MGLYRPKQSLSDHLVNPCRMVGAGSPSLPNHSALSFFLCVTSRSDSVTLAKLWPITFGTCRVVGRPRVLPREGREGAPGTLLAPAGRVEWKPRVFAPLDPLWQRLVYDECRRNMLMDLTGAMARRTRFSPGHPTHLVT